ncbi:MAG: hypothetical protein H6828_11065 [Planctomycetes bacterium]|nr:hypothetical protein [Planctomycetota bacterium]
MKRTSLARRLAPLVLLLGACDAATPPAPSWPAGTVLAVDGEPVRAEQVERHLEAMGRLDPAYAADYRRRWVLTEVVLPLAYGRARAEASAREAARRAAEAYVAEGGQDAVAGPPEPPLAGTWKTLGLDLWLEVQGLEPGQSTGVVELPGRFVVAELLARDGDAYGGRERFELRLHAFPYVAEPAALATALLEADLVIVDPAWEELVPGFWKYHMQGDS